MAGERDHTLENLRRPAPQTVRRLSVTVTRGPDAGRNVERGAGDTVSVGSAADNDLVLADGTVSRYHLELAPSADGIVVKDLGSLNGTSCGAVRIREGVIAKGSQLKIGDSTLLVDAAEAPTPAEEPAEIPGAVFESEAMRALGRRVRSLGAFAGAILIQGETGTGKELIASALHALSPRHAAPFVIVDCASLPATLVEAELFGHERGAFTGADRGRAGAFERANGGTIFLDEVGELPPAVQPALLGVLQRKRFHRVGGDKEITVDLRVVAATNRDLRAEVNRGAFRADLYYRLAGARVVVPPLRERPEDIPVLVKHFALEITGSADSPFSPEALEELRAQHWAGNARELRSVVERAIAFGGQSVGALLDPHDAPAEAASAAAPARLERYRDARAKALTTFERHYLTTLIEAAGGNASEAARRAEMDRPYLLSLLRKYGLR